MEIDKTTLDFCLSAVCLARNQISVGDSLSADSLLKSVEQMLSGKEEVKGDGDR